MCNHLKVIIEVSLIPFYTVLYLRLEVSEQDLGCFGGKQFRSWGIGAKALPELYKHLIYNQCNMCKHLLEWYKHLIYNKCNVYKH